MLIPVFIIAGAHITKTHPATLRFVLVVWATVNTSFTTDGTVAIVGARLAQALSASVLACVAYSNFRLKKMYMKC